MCIVCIMRIVCIITNTLLCCGIYLRNWDITIHIGAIQYNINHFESLSFRHIIHLSKYTQSIYILLTIKYSNLQNEFWSITHWSSAGDNAKSLKATCHKRQTKLTLQHLFKWWPPTIAGLSNLISLYGSKTFAFCS